MASPIISGPTTPSATLSQPRFSPTSLPSSTSDPLSTSFEQWTTPLTAPAYFPLSIFISVMQDLALHPERNSSLILRADPLPTPPPSTTPTPTPTSTSTTTTSEQDEGERLGLELVKDVKVRLLPRQPKRDDKIDQRCRFYRTPEPEHDEAVSASAEVVEQGLVIMEPLVGSVSEVPYYHPPVRKLAFRWKALPQAPTPGSTGSTNPTSNGTTPTASEIDSDLGNQDKVEDSHPSVLGTITISYLPFPEGTGSTPSTPLGLSPTRTKVKKRSPLAGPESSAPPPAVILAPKADETTPVPGREATTDERLNRTCLALLERLHKHGLGVVTGYQKRRFHDVVVPREAFQDLYLILKDRHRQLDSRVPRAGSNKIEDVKRHVWKEPGTPDDGGIPTGTNLSDWGEQDVAVAAFLMLLWKDMYPARQRTREKGVEGEVNEWDSWGRPEGGFVDLGCGNGLLVHILVSEGYSGVGYELRARRTWPQYPSSTQESLIELPIEMPSWFPTTIEEWEAQSWPGKEFCKVDEGSFLIGNHADELTPWLPLLSLLPSVPVPHLSLPCCLHTLDGPFTALTFTPPPHPHTPAGGLDEGLDAGVSRYKAYIMWLGWCGLMCGWEWEKEGLRVPSTRGWGIVARKRWTSGEEDKECRKWALEQVNEVRRRGAFKIREKEGKEH